MTKKYFIRFTPKKVNNNWPSLRYNIFTISRILNNILNFEKCYFDESWYTVSLNDSLLSLADRKLSTYINSLAKAGFVIEEMVEESENKYLENNDSLFAQKAQMLPVTFVIKARKQ